MTLDPQSLLSTLYLDGRALGQYHALPKLQEAGYPGIARLPVSIRIVLESLLRHMNGEHVEPHHVAALANWKPVAARTDEVPFMVNRIVAPDSSGVPLLADLAAMRDAAVRQGYPAGIIEPLVRVDLVVDHSLLVERSASPDAAAYNLAEEFRRNRERYQFLKWAGSSFRNLQVVPPGVGIIHQINIEKLSAVVDEKDGILFPDSLVGTDSHTPMINGIGVLGWGVGGIEAEAVMLGQPIYFLTPDVVGFELTGQVGAGVTATDLVLTIVQALRKAKVVGKFVEFFGDGASTLAAADRCTIANMAPEYGATSAFFPIDEATLSFLRETGRDPIDVARVKAYFTAQGMFGMPARGDIDYSSVLSLDLSVVQPCIAGPNQPEQRIPLGQVAQTFGALPTPGSKRQPQAKPPRDEDSLLLRNGDIVLAAITSCANTSNPGVLLAAGLLAKKAVEKGLTVRQDKVKTSFTPGSRVVDDYLSRAGLQPYLDALGFHIAGHGCATCMGNGGPLNQRVQQALLDEDLTVCSVLSGNRNFEARIHPAIKANFLMSPPLVVAYAIAGRMDIDLTSDPMGAGARGEPVYLRDIWPADDEIEAAMTFAKDGARFRAIYSGFRQGDAQWQDLPVAQGATFGWDPDSSYLQPPPFFEEFSIAFSPPAPMAGARPLVILGDSVTTDHINPASFIHPDSPAGKYLTSLQVGQADFNSYIARRTNHDVMIRGVFANPRLRNAMVPGTEGGMTRWMPSGEVMTVFEAAMAYRRQGVPLVIIAGEDYGIGSSRDWAAKGPYLLGVRAVIARGFERIHRSNLVGMGILPCEFTGDDSAQTLRLDGSESFTLEGLENGLSIRQKLALRIARADGSEQVTTVLVRIDTPVEAQYFRHGGLLPYVLRRQLQKSTAQGAVAR